VRIQLLTILFITSVVHALPAAQIDKSKSSEDSNGWKKTADSFMDNLAANRIDAAVDLMEPAFLKALGSRDSAKSALVHLFDYCGRPLDSQFQHEERGYKQYPDGRRKEMRKFFYDASTDQYAKGVCFFAIEIVPGDTGSGGYRVTTFGPLRRLGGR